MDTRRVLTITAAACLSTGCASLVGMPSPIAEPRAAPTPVLEATPAVLLSPLPATARPYLEAIDDVEPAAQDPADSVPALPPARTGRAAIAAANSDARAASRSDQFVGGVQMFAWSPGRVYEVWTAPLRVTTLTLGPGETVVSKAAGDTVRWQIGDTTSGTGADARTHILLKPLERGLETNLVLTTSHRVYWLDLKSGSADGFNAAIAWDTPIDAPADADVGASGTDLVMPDGALDARYRIRPRGRAPRWTPTAVFNDGVRTFITLPAAAWSDEVPALFVIAADGEAQLANYRQQGGLLVIDRVFDRAELRSSDRRPRVVRLERVVGGQP